jgi:hypothetical protein
VLATPVLTLISNSQNLVSNTGWRTSLVADEIRAVAAQVGAFPLDENSGDSVILATLSAGRYSFQVGSSTGATGEILLE